MELVDDEGDGPPLVLLHGQPGDAAELAPLRIALRRSGFRVLVVDRPGYAGDPSAATGYAGNATALVGLLDRLGLERAYVGAMSWSGGAALVTGLDHPERVAGLLLASSVGGPGSVLASDRLTALPLVVRGAGWAYSHLAGLLEASSGSRLTPAGRQLAYDAAARWSRRGGWRAFEVEQRALVAGTGPLWERLAPMPFPVTVVHGRRDRYVPVSAGRLLAGRLQARYVEVEAGHVLHLEAPALLAAELGRLRESTHARDHRA